MNNLLVSKDSIDFEDASEGSNIKNQRSRYKTRLFCNDLLCFEPWQHDSTKSTQKMLMHWKTCLFTGRACIFAISEGCVGLPDVASAW